MIKTIIKRIARTTQLNKSFSEKARLAVIASRLHTDSLLYKRNKKFRQTSFLGLNVSAYSFQTIDYLFDEIFIGNEYFFESEKLNPIIIDCGANIGFATLYFKKLYPASKIICFEANPHSFEVLNENITQNNFTNVEIHNKAVSNKEGKISFYIGHKETLHGSISSERGGQEEITCDTVRLSTYINQYDIVDFVKIDIEGAEWLVLEDLSSSGAINKVKQFIVEYHHKIGNEHSNLASFLKVFEEHNFEYNIKANYFSRGDFQDIIIHFYKK